MVGLDREKLPPFISIHLPLVFRRLCDSSTDASSAGRMVQSLIIAIAARKYSVNRSRPLSHTDYPSACSQGSNFSYSSDRCWQASLADSSSSYCTIGGSMWLGKRRAGTVPQLKSSPWVLMIDSQRLTSHLTSPYQEVPTSALKNFSSILNALTAGEHTRGKYHQSNSPSAGEVSRLSSCSRTSPVSLH